MREGAKRRLAGAIAIVALVVIFVPMLFEEKTPVSSPQDQDLTIPPEPAIGRSASGSESFLGPADSGVGGVAMDQDVQVDALPLPPQGAPVAQTGRTPGPDTLPAEPETYAAPAVDTPAPVSGLPPAGQSGSTTPVPARNTTSAPRPAVQPGMLSWVVQVASLTTPQSASALESRLRAAGYAAFVEQAQISGKTYYRVRVGPESDRSRIEQVAAMLQQQQHLDTLIQQYP